ncbi:MAG: DEAD/DEAH box helicase family protein, partial [Myxococcales bacterium]|nr:DEAD/DEAH box helicase family protein [Myxococcales bacterium]
MTMSAPPAPDLFKAGSHITPADVRELLDFTIARNTRYDAMASTQTEGVAALYNILCDNRFAYLADEVGMGKTYQALGLAAIVWSLDPMARIVFISPRRILQDKWCREYNNFFSSNYRRDLGKGCGDGRVTSVLLGEPFHGAAPHGRLKEWAISLANPKTAAAFLRHTSFTRPVFTNDLNNKNIAVKWAEWRTRLSSWGLHHTDEAPGRAPLEDASRQFNIAFADAFNKMLSDRVGRNPTFDLVIVDEAQCLRHPDNQTNEVLRTIFRRHVGKWLFMSATPVHGGLGDLQRVLNTYPDPDGDAFIHERLLADMEALQARMAPLMVRRQRKYVVDASGT